MIDPKKTYRIAELQDAAYHLMASKEPAYLLLPTYLTGGGTAALFGYWLAHKEVGCPLTPEVKVHSDDGGGMALICASGFVLHWDGTDVKAL